MIDYAVVTTISNLTLAIRRDRTQAEACFCHYVEGHPSQDNIRLIEVASDGSETILAMGS